MNPNLKRGKRICICGHEVWDHSVSLNICLCCKCKQYKEKEL